MRPVISKGAQKASICNILMGKVKQLWMMQEHLFIFYANHIDHKYNLIGSVHSA